MSRLVSMKTKKIDLGDGEWVEVREALSFTELQPVLAKIDQGESIASNASMAMELIHKAVVNWCFLDDSGQEIPFNKEDLANLNMLTVTDIMSEIMPMYFPEKKNLETSNEPSLQEQQYMVRPDKQ